MTNFPAHRQAPSRAHAPALVAVLALLAGSPASASEGVRGVLGLSVTGGGDTLSVVQFSNGSTQSIKTGGLSHLFGGVEYRAGGFVVQGNLGYHSDSTSATNGNLSFSRVPVEALAFWQPSENFRVGGGVRKALSAKFKGTGAASNVGTVRYDGNVGLVLQGEYLFSGGRYSLLGRYVSEKYSTSGFRSDGNHVGFGFVFRF